MHLLFLCPHRAISSMFKSFFRKDSIKERDSPEGGPFDLQVGRQ
jgi:hypothetical protein